ncbi:MAG: ATP-binding protein, partial [Rubrivivax sp.]
VEVALHAAVATLAVVLLAYLWLGARTRRELAPLQRLSERLASHDLLAPQATLGPAERAELQPVHAAIDTLAAQLSRRLAQERLVAAHAAHALRTPLAGIDAQLAVALRECPPALRPRLQRVREASARLQRVVAALIAMFRSGVELQRRPIDLAALLARLPVEGLDVQVPAGATVTADADLLTAALVNLLDNAVRHGGHTLVVTVPAPQRLRVVDDGPGVSPLRRAALQRMLDAIDPSDDAGSGLGLRLVDRVARVHGGRLTVLDDSVGFGVELTLDDSADYRRLPPRAGGPA